MLTWEAQHLDRTTVTTSMDPDLDVGTASGTFTRMNATATLIFSNDLLLITTLIGRSVCLYI